MQSIELKKKRLIDRIREPDPVPSDYNRYVIREGVKNAFKLLEEKSAEISKDQHIHSQQESVEAIIKQHSALAVFRRTTGITRTEEELQEQLEWLHVIVPWIVKTQFNSFNKKRNNRNKTNGGVNVKNEKEQI
jgi:hypothetical protein